MKTPLLDTHSWVWWMIGDKRLGEKTARILDNFDPDNRPFLASISLWEISMLYLKQRLNLNIDLEAWLQRAANSSTVRLIPITVPIVLEMSKLPTTLHNDPADRLIISTARILDAPVITKDKLVKDSGLVELVDYF